MIWFLFILIQLVSAVLTVIGVFVVGLLSLIKAWRPRLDRWHWPTWAWIWDNDIDGVSGSEIPTRWTTFYWSGLRNPCNNLRFVKGVSQVGRPLFYRTWIVRGRTFYFKAGWMSDGYPALSGGSGKGY